MTSTESATELVAALTSTALVVATSSLGGSDGGGNSISNGTSPTPDEDTVAQGSYILVGCLLQKEATRG